MTKYAISWEQGSGMPVYFTTIEYISSRYDAYGSSPEKKIWRTALLGEAKLFDTEDDAMLELTEKIGSPYGLQDTRPVQIIEVTDKQIFKAKLAEE